MSFEVLFGEDGSVRFVRADVCVDGECSVDGDCVPRMCDVEVPDIGEGDAIFRSAGYVSRSEGWILKWWPGYARFL